MLSDSMKRFLLAALVAVLILVLMEYALWRFLLAALVAAAVGLNPCFNGICSLTGASQTKTTRTAGLNPCFNGICSLTRPIFSGTLQECEGLNPCFNGICSLTCLSPTWVKKVYWSLNPCFNGICSLTLKSRNPVFLRHYKTFFSLFFTNTTKNMPLFSGCKITKNVQHVKEQLR